MSARPDYTDAARLAHATRQALRELVERRAGVLPTAAALVAGDAVAEGVPGPLRSRTGDDASAHAEGGRA